MNASDDGHVAPYFPSMLLAGPPCPLPVGLKPLEMPAEAIWSEQELRGTLVAAHLALAAGQPIERIAKDIRRVPEAVQEAFRHLAAALLQAAASPTTPYSRPVQ